MPNTNLAFLLGSPRSGTTLLSLLLDQHPLIHCPPEPWLLLALGAFGQTPPAHPADSALVSRQVSRFLEEERNATLKDVAIKFYQKELQRVGKALLIDKTPRYYLCLDLLEEFFPEKKGICLLRNPLDVAASYLTSWDVNLPNVIRGKSDSPFFFDYVIGFDRLLKLSAKYHLLTLQYEKLVRNPECEVARVLEYLGVVQSTNISTTSVDPEIYSKDQGYVGDKKIFENPTVHTKSVGSYKQVFTAEEISVLLGALGRDAFFALGYGNVWDEALGTFSLSAVEENNLELTALAEGYLERRKISCQKAENNYYFNQQVDDLNAQNAELVRQVEYLNTKNVQLTQEVESFRNMGFRARLGGLLIYTKRSAKKFARSAICRMADGKPLSPLPRISLVTPVFNGEAHIGETLESVLQQKYPNLEYIVVDGGSTDGTLDIVRRYEERTDLPQRISLVISGPDEGMYDAVAKGFERASGEIYCYLNADDLLEGDCLTSVGEYFARHPGVQAIYHEDVVLVDGWRYPNVRQPESVDTVDFLAGHILFQDGVFWRRELYKSVGGIRRDLRLAGDFDLWLRMSAHCRFVRRPGHVSCFRIRPGQLSAQMQRYNDEMKRATQDFLAAMPTARRLGLLLRKPLRKARRRLYSKLRRDRLFFPIDFANMPPPAIRIPPMAGLVPRSPIDGKPAERLLFSTPDTRFGEREICYVYLDTRHGIAITHPPIKHEKLDELYRKYYSNPPTELVPPSGASPYREFNGRRFWEKLLLRLPVEKLDRFFHNAWGDNTLSELAKVLKASRVDVSAPLRFLDAGCFEGHLLDQIRERKAWRAYGLEPNAHAVGVAKSKGHTVWLGHAEHAVETIPEGYRFDVIFMGQSIEHVNDPVRVLRRLRLLLAPGGVLVMSTPNLDSREIDHFGPTWAHWHTPYHRYIFSKKGLNSLVCQVGLMSVYFRSFSHPYWTTMSIAQNRLGLGGSASHAVSFDSTFSLRARRYQFWKRLLWDRMGKGDYCFIAAKDDASD